MENSILLLVLTLIPGIGPARIKAIIEHFHDQLKNVLHADVTGLMQMPGIGEPLARQIYNFLHHTDTRLAAEKSAEEQISRLHKLNASLITILDPAYPPF